MSLERLPWKKGVYFGPIKIIEGGRETTIAEEGQTNESGADYHFKGEHGHKDLVTVTVMDHDKGKRASGFIIHTVHPGRPGPYDQKKFNLEPVVDFLLPGNRVLRHEP